MATSMKPKKGAVSSSSTATTTTTTTTTTPTKKKTKEKPKVKVNLKDFEIMTLIGRGSYGEVKICRKIDTRVVYAMKVMKKRSGLKERHIARILAERDLMAFGDNPWIVQLFYSFQDDQNLYLVMEFMQGGDLMGILIRHDLLTEDQTRFYVAEIALAIKSVHDLDYCHRDLKPDNVLLDKDGHIKLTDFGLAIGLEGSFAGKESSGSTMSQIKEPEKKVSHTKKKENYRRKRREIHSMVGTPDYMAPEICSRKKEGYKQNCDWWSLGVIMFECMCGYPPFYADDSTQTINKVKNWKKEFRFPDEPGGLTNVKISDLAKDLIKKLISDPTKRLTFDAIKKHKWFGKLDWDGIRAGDAIIKPPIKSDVDIGNFDQFSEGSKSDPAKQPPPKGKMEPIIGYTFQRVKSTKEVEDDFFGINEDEGDDSSEDD